MNKEICPCGSKKKYQYCCGQYLSGKATAETAEKLMRSRYTAFCQGNIDYLIATLYPDQRTETDRAELTKTINNTKWLSLTIINTNQGKKNDAIAYVEFEAIYQVNEPRQLHERSKFIKKNNQWFYVEGDILPGTIPKRNEPCWCRSGKKFKQCHGN
jgi:SEC-C motif-containing protein